MLSFSPILRAIRNYFLEIYYGVRSVVLSCFTAAPYLFGVGDLRKEVTEQYPDPISSRTEDDLPPRTRGLLFNDIEKCTGCGDCARVCPSRCIRVETEPTPDHGKEWVSVFDVDFAKCIFCGLCVEVCAPQSLIHTRKFEMSVTDLKELNASFGRGRLTSEQRQKWSALRKHREDE